MNPYVNEEVMWQRLKDIQAEADNRRLVGRRPSVIQLAAYLGRRAWLVAGLAMRRPPRVHPGLERDDATPVSDVA